MRGFIVALAGCAWLGSSSLGADVWDVGRHNDNSLSWTHNELLHGMEQVHDLAGQYGGTVADVDWYRLQVPFNTSFEVVLDEVGGGISNGGNAPVLQLIDPVTMGAVQTAAPVTAFGIARRLSYSTAAPGSAGEKTYYVRVQGAACNVACTADDRYRLRYYDTTLRLPRFNNTGGQVSVLIVQNPTRRQVSLIGYAFGALGAPLATIALSLEPYEAQPVDLTSVAGGALAGKAGGILFLNTAGFGELSGKAVGMDPATGFVFEATLTYRAY